eukprot:scaffold54538_cov66-Cyclotella_meneghiniana.AAC.6
MYHQFFKSSLPAISTAAALTAAAWSHRSGEDVVQCETTSGKDVVGMLTDLDARLQNIEKTLGASSNTNNSNNNNKTSSSSSSLKDKYHNDAIGKSKTLPGIDVVLGSQWGDEGKGKLVDLLSQIIQIPGRSCSVE